MRSYRKFIPVLLIVLSLASGCFGQPYTLETTVTGVIEETKVKEKFLADDEFIMVKGKGDHEGSSVSVYEIPVSDSDSYEIGQKVQVAICSNTNEDVWDPDEMKFDILILEFASYFNRVQPTPIVTTILASW